MAEISANKRLGQHFLTDEGVISRLVTLIRPQQGESIVEIGPGLGALTLPLLSRCGTLTAIEFDTRVLDLLRRDSAGIGALRLIHANVLDICFAELSLPMPLKIVGNLPYNLSSPILFHCLAQAASISEMYFMLQKEFVERLCAEPGSRAYGRLSIMAQLYAVPHQCFDIPPTAFDPPPRVDSAVVCLRPRAKPAWVIDDYAVFDALIRHAFSQRRKMLRKSLERWFDTQTLTQLEIDPTQRPEQLSGADFARLANYLSQQPSCNNLP